MPSTQVNCMDRDPSPITLPRATPSPWIVEKDVVPNGGGAVDLYHLFLNCQELMDNVELML